MFIETCNPATGELIKQYPLMSLEQVTTTITATQQAFLTWRELDFTQRASYLRATATLLRQRKLEYAQIIAQEMGKPIIDGQKEIEKSAWVCEHYADSAVQQLAPRIITTNHQHSYVCYQPLGIIFAIMPWNFPFWQVFRFVAPNLMAGNAAILSHAPIVTGAALAIEQLLQDAGFPQDLLRAIIVDHKTAAAVIKHDSIKGVTLTGSPRAGSSVAMQAGQALKKVVLELGGNDPYLILADANLEHAAQTCVTSRLANAGQVCIAAKRIIVDQSIYADFEQLVLEKVQRYRMGNPLETTTTLGPIARADLRANVHQQVQNNISQGAKLLLGGTLPSGPGFFYPATVLSNITHAMPVMREEIFGPIVSLIRAENETQAIKLANASPYGLAAAVFTQDRKRGEEIAAKQLQAGNCYVNNLVSSDPRLPFGGIKESGFGRELGTEGLHEFVNIKSVCID